MTKNKISKSLTEIREAEGVTKACTSKHHNVLFGILLCQY